MKNSGAITDDTVIIRIHRSPVHSRLPETRTSAGPSEELGPLEDMRACWGRLLSKTAQSPARLRLTTERLPSTNQKRGWFFSGSFLKAELSLWIFWSRARVRVNYVYGASGNVLALS